MGNAVVVEATTSMRILPKNQTHGPEAADVLFARVAYRAFPYDLL
jgi:hypothetical protein